MPHEHTGEELIGLIRLVVKVVLAGVGDFLEISYLESYTVTGV